MQNVTVIEILNAWILNMFVIQIYFEEMEQNLPVFPTLALGFSSEVYVIPRNMTSDEKEHLLMYEEKLYYRCWHLKLNAGRTQQIKQHLWTKGCIDSFG